MSIQLSNNIFKNHYMLIVEYTYDYID